MDDNLELKTIDVEPITDEIFNQVLAGIGDEDGLSGPVVRRLLARTPADLAHRSRWRRAAAGRCLSPSTQKGKEVKIMPEKVDIEMVDIEPITDEILEQVLGGIGDEDGISNSCSTNTCSNTC